jgi:hypothetical protein
MGVAKGEKAIRATLVVVRNAGFVIRLGVLAVARLRDTRFLPGLTVRVLVVVASIAVVSAIVGLIVVLFTGVTLGLVLIDAVPARGAFSALQLLA